jgi:hypothetical protein
MPGWVCFDDTQNGVELCEPRYELTFSFTETYLLDPVHGSSSYFSLRSLFGTLRKPRGLGYNDLFDFEIEPNAEWSVGTVKEKGASASEGARARHTVPYQQDRVSRAASHTPY